MEGGTKVESSTHRLADLMPSGFGVMSLSSLFCDLARRDDFWR